MVNVVLMILNLLILVFFLFRSSVPLFGFRGGGGPSPLFNHFNLPFHPHHHHHHPHAQRPALPPPPLESPPQMKMPPVEDSCLAAALQGVGPPALTPREGNEDGGTGHPLKLAASACGNGEDSNENEAVGGENGLTGVVCKGWSWLEF